MRAATLKPIRAGLLVGGLGMILSCSDGPTTPVGADNSETVPTFAQGAGKKFKPTIHIARVRSDGTLVDGTALTATRFNTGAYILSFPPPIDKCAASANSASFEGFDSSAFRVSAQISIGFGSGGVFNDSGVNVSFFSTSDGSATDTSFSLILVCP